MIKLPYITFCFLLFVLFLSCKDNETNTKTLTTEADLALDKNCHPISANINNELRIYRNMEILPKTDKGMVKPSYFISFFKKYQDTIMMMGYQPYVLELFPDHAINYKLDLTPKDVGIVEVDSYPLMIYDLDDKLGDHMYDSKCLNIKIPQEYFIKPDSFVTHVGPLRLYQITGDKLNFLREVKKMVLK